MASTLIRMASVMDRETFHVIHGDDVAFTTRCDDSGHVQRTLAFSRRDWEDMGRPDRLTVTVEPGDRLNEED
jgi:hypothetical protein